MKKHILFYCILCFPLALISQDVHFSQFDAVPVLSNPANAGNFEGDIRLVANYRNQWATIDGYNTMDLTVDFPFLFSKYRLGSGLVILNDNSANKRASLKKIYIPLSLHKIIGNDKFSFGIQAGLFSWSFDKMSLASQFDGRYYNADYGETENPFDQNNIAPDVIVGMAWQRKNTKLSPYAEIALAHVNLPSEGYMSKSSEHNLLPRISVQGGAKMTLSSITSLEPKIYYAAQERAQELLLGGYYTRAFQHETFGNVKLFGGPFVRTNLIENFDAAIITVGVQALNTRFGLSYDINLSKLRKYTRHYGGVEFSLIYIFDFVEKNEVREPCILIY